jgi:hypothetical protein
MITTKKSPQGIELIGAPLGSDRPKVRAFIETLGTKPKLTFNFFGLNENEHFDRPDYFVMATCVQALLKEATKVYEAVKKWKKFAKKT